MTTKSILSSHFNSIFTKFSATQSAPPLFINTQIIPPNLTTSNPNFQSPLFSSVSPVFCSSATSMAACIHKFDPKRPESDEPIFKYCEFSTPNFSDSPISAQFDDSVEKDEIWSKMIDEAQMDAQQEPILLDYYFDLILSQRSLDHALANLLGSKLGNSNLSSTTLREVFLSVFIDDVVVKRSIREDLRAVKERDPACISYVHCLLNFKGYLACQAHRVAHKLWSQERRVLALLIQNRVSEVFAVDIHPGARLGSGILLDHATGVVIGETAVIGNNVSILHGVTLGGTGKDSGDRHPKIGDGVLIGASTHILGNVRIGEGAKIGAGSLVLREVPARTTAVGNPARLIGGKEKPVRLDNLPSLTMDHTSFIHEWSDYVI